MSEINTPYEKGNSPDEAVAGSSKPDGIVMIPVEKIKEFHWATGIRDQKKYDLLKQNIKEHGLNNPIIVRALEDGYFEPFIGDHRVRIVKELVWKKVPCIVKNIDVDKALERCVSDNVCRADYSCVELENKITELWNSQRYKTRGELGNRIGLTGERVGQLLYAKEIRDKGPFDESISTQAILDTKPLDDDKDKIALLELVIKKKFKPSDIKTKAKQLSKLDFEKRNKVLYDGVDLEDISKEVKAKIEKKMPKETKSTITVSKEHIDLMPKLYDICNDIGNFIGLMDDQKREESVEYAKVCCGLLLETIKNNNGLAERTFETFVNEALKLDVGILHNYDGTRTRTIDHWL